MTDIAERIKTLRLMLQLNQKDLAEATGFSQPYVCGIEKGVKIPNADFLITLSIKFGLNIIWLINGFGPMFSGNNEKNVKYLIREKAPSYLSSEGINCIAEGIRNGSMFIFDVKSDNMEPLFMKGDKAVIDSTVKELQNYRIYLFDIESQKTLKRCFKIEEYAFKLTNDKPIKKNNDLIFDNSMECLGQVVWIIRKI